MKNICDWNNCFEEGSYKAPVEKIVEDVTKMLQDLADKGFLKEC